MINRSKFINWLFFHQYNKRKEVSKYFKLLIHLIMSHVATPLPKSVHQLPLIPKKTFHLNYPIIDRMKTLHTTNIKTIRKQQLQSQNTLQNYSLNKSHYFQTIHKHKQQHAHKVLKSLQNKSTLLSKENSQKLKKHQQLYSSFMAITKQKIKSNYLKEKNKLQSAFERKQKLGQSRIKNSFNNKPNYRKMYLEELGKSQELQRTTIQKLMDADNRRKQIVQQKQNLAKGQIQRSIYHAQIYVYQKSKEKQQQQIEKSVNKMRTSERLISERRQQSRSHSETSRKSSQQKLIKAQSSRRLRQQQLIEKLQRILQQKNKKTENIKQRKEKNLEILANTLRKSRSQHIEQAQKKSRMIEMDKELRSEQILQETHQKWKFLTGLKTQFNKVRTQNLYESQQVSLRF